METQDHYAVLGVPFNADAAAIRRAFRQRVKQIHPDVAADKEQATEAFIRLKEAYNVLSDPRRRTTYDVSIANRRPRPPSATRPHPGGATTPTGVRDASAQQPSALTIDELLQRALRELATNRNAYARRDLAAVLAREPENPDAMLLMGRLYRAEGQTEEWIRVLEEGVRKNPSNAALRLALNDAIRTRSELPFIRESPESRKDQQRRACTAIGLMGSSALFLWGMYHGKAPVAALRGFIDIPAGLLWCTLLAAAVAGWAMASSGYIAPIDDELFFPDTRGRSLKRKYSRNDAPVGLAVPVMALIHYALAVSVIALLMLTRGIFSRSLVIVCALAFGLAFAMALASPPTAGAILFWCPGWLLFAEFCGWYTGEFFRI